MTNFDLITESPEKLALVIAKATDCCGMNGAGCMCCPLVDSRSCSSDGLFEWLEEEIEERW